MSSLHYYFSPNSASHPQELNVDICIYGGSAGAVTAAVQAARSGRTCALLLNTAWLGGLTSGGLGFTDIGNEAAIGGMAREFYRRVGDHYGVEEEWCFEPHVAEKVFRAMLAEAGITPHFKQFIKSLKKENGRILSVQMESGLKVTAKQFIDASYEGDLMAMAGVSWTFGREGNEVYGELVNGVQLRDKHQFEMPISPYLRDGDPRSGLLPGINEGPLAPQGSGDRRVQAYNFRMCLTRAKDRLPFPKPESYNPLQYELLARYVARGWREMFHKYDRVRNGKTDTNNHGAVSTDFIGGSDRFPEASYAEREEIFQRHVAYQQGLMWFWHNDPRIPASIQQEMRTWGLAADEFQDTAGWSRQLYIRECRRMVTDYVATELDCRGFRKADDAVGLGAYALDSHNCQRLVLNGRVFNEGDVQVKGFEPYPISYRSIVPRRNECINLTVPVCLAASHIAYGSIRMEPVFMILGQSSAIAAHLAIGQGDGAVQDVTYATLRNRLEQADQRLSVAPKIRKAPVSEEVPVPQM